MFADDYADAVAAELAENGVWVEFVDLSYTGALAFWGDRKVTVERAQEVLFAGWGFGRGEGGMGKAVADPYVGSRGERADEV